MLSQVGLKKHHKASRGGRIPAQLFQILKDHAALKILKEIGIPDNLTSFLRNLNTGQEAIVRIRHGTIDWFQIRKGVGQD